jgi:uncharacterized protein DUF3606
MPVRKPKTKRGRRQDRQRVAGTQKHEVAYVAKVGGKSPHMVREVIKIKGNSRIKLMEALELLHEVLNMILPPKTKPTRRKKKIPMT